MPRRKDDLVTIFRLYAHLARVSHLDPPPCESFSETEDPSVVQDVQRWVEHIDEQVACHQLRQFLQITADPTEETLRSLIQHYRNRRSRTPADRDKLDFLLVQYAYDSQLASAAGSPITPRDIAGALRPVLGDVAELTDSWLEPLQEILRQVEQCRSLREMIERDCLGQGRWLKESVGENFWEPQALVAFTWFNFVMRRAYFRLVRADVQAIGRGLDELAKRGTCEVDCRRAQLSEAEPVSSLQKIRGEWLELFRAPYSAGLPLAQLAAIRASVEEALPARVRSYFQATSRPLPVAQAPPELASVNVSDAPAPLDRDRLAENARGDSEEAAALLLQLVASGCPEPEAVPQSVHANSQVPPPSGEIDSLPETLKNLFDSCRDQRTDMGYSIEDGPAEDIGGSGSEAASLILESVPAEPQPPESDAQPLQPDSPAPSPEDENASGTESLKNFFKSNRAHRTALGYSFNACPAGDPAGDGGPVAAQIPKSAPAEPEQPELLRMECGSLLPLLVPADSPGSEKLLLSPPPQEDCQVGSSDNGRSSPSAALKICLESIREQLNSPGNALHSATNAVRYHGTRLLLHSWESESFVHAMGDESTALQSAVAARALLTEAQDEFRSSGDPAPLEALIELAEQQVAQLRKAVERARGARSLETAANLSASSKRLLVSIDMAKKLRAGR